MFNETMLLVALAIADGVLQGIDTIDDLWAQRLTSEDGTTHLPFHDWAQNKYVLRKCTVGGGMTEDKMPRAAFQTIFRRALRSAGYPNEASVHAIRRQLGKKIDQNYSEVQRSQHLTQSDTRVFGTSYVANCSSVDGDSMFTGRERDDTVTEYFQGLQQFREPGLPASLPLVMRKDLDTDPELCKLQAVCDDLELTSSSKEEVKSAKRAVTRHRKRLEATALQKYQKDWIAQQRRRRVETKGQASQAQPCVDKTGIMWLILPQRGRIAAMLVSDTRAYTQDLGLITADLVSLCVPPKQIHLPDCTPRHEWPTHCPVTSCHRDLENASTEKLNANEHIMECMRADKAQKYGGITSDVQYCYVCYTWVTGRDAWEEHCASHLQSWAVLVCGTLTYYKTTIRPAFCPFCLGDESLNAAERLVTFCRDATLRRHLDTIHVAKLRYPVECPHPLCGKAVIASSNELDGHWKDVHGVNPGRHASRPISRKRILEATIDVRHSGIETAQAQKRRKMDELQVHSNADFAPIDLTTEAIAMQTVPGQHDLALEDDAPPPYTVFAPVRENTSHDMTLRTQSSSQGFEAVAENEDDVDAAAAASADRWFDELVELPLDDDGSSNRVLADMGSQVQRTILTKPLTSSPDTRNQDYLVEHASTVEALIMRRNATGQHSVVPNVHPQDLLLSTYEHGNESPVMMLQAERSKAKEVRVLAASGTTTHNTSNRASISAGAHKHTSRSLKAGLDQPPRKARFQWSWSEGNRIIWKIRPVQSGSCK